MSIRKPAADGHSVLGVKDIGGGRVVDDDRILQVASYLRQIFHVVTLMIVATLPEKSVVHHPVYIELVQERIAVLQTNG